jgi:hypothetical protein
VKLEYLPNCQQIASSGNTPWWNFRGILLSQRSDTAGLIFEAGAQ